ncbi:glycoside hydrolase family 43 protein [Pseudolysinimonas sp.]
MTMRLHRNPIQRDGDFADPFVLRHDGRYYLYATNPDIRCWSSDDLLGWRLEGPTIADDVFPGLVPFAPEVIYSDGAFYLYTSPSGQGHTVLRADAPTGPFVPVTGNVGMAIDGNVLRDDDGTWYFYWAGDEGIWGCVMPSPTEFGEPVFTGIHMNGWTEGPFVSKSDGVYLMTLTGNHYLSPGYRIDAAWSDHPLTGYRPNPLNPLVLSTDGPIVGLGHSSSVRGPDLVSTWMAYHDMTPDLTRKLDLDRQIGAGRDLVVLGPTASAPAPAGPDVAWRGATDVALPPGAFTAELTLTAAPGVDYALLVGDVAVRVDAAGGTLSAAGVEASFPAGHRHEVAHCWLLIADGSALRVLVDDRVQLEVPVAPAGRLTVEGLARVGHGALTATTADLADARAVRPVPGRFWVSGSANGVRAPTEPIEHGIHVQRAGRARVSLTGEFSADDVVGLAIDDVEHELRADAAGRLLATDVDLAADARRLRVRVLAGSPLLALVTVSSAPTAGTAEFADEHQVGWGKRLLGDDTWADVELTATLTVDIEAPGGHADLLLRAGQLSEGGEGDDARLGIDFLLGYSVQLHADRIVLARHAYDSRVLAVRELTLPPEPHDLVVRAIGSTLSVALDGIEVLRADDDLAHPLGGVGLRTVNARLHVAHLRIAEDGRH